MTITRMNPAILDMEDDSNGVYVRYSDYLKAVESLEYDLRYEREQKEEALDEMQHWKDMYNSLYGQQQL